MDTLSLYRYEMEVPRSRVAMNGPNTGWQEIDYVPENLIMGYNLREKGKADFISTEKTVLDGGARVVAAQKATGFWKWVQYTKQERNVRSFRKIDIFRPEVDKIVSAYNQAREENEKSKGVAESILTRLV